MHPTPNIPKPDTPGSNVNGNDSLGHSAANFNHVAKTAGTANTMNTSNIGTTTTAIDTGPGTANEK